MSDDEYDYDEELRRRDAKIERLRAELAATAGRHVEWVKLHQQEVDDAHRQRMAAEAESDRLRELLRKIVRSPEILGLSPDYSPETTDFFVALDAALKEGA